MANLYKKKFCATDPVTGECLESRSAKWWGRYRDHKGKERRVPLARDKGAAQAMLNRLVTREENRAAGKIDQYDDHAAVPIADHLRVFRHSLADRGSTDDYVRMTVARLRKVLEGSGVKFIGDLDAGKVDRFLANYRRQGRSIASSNHYLRAVKMFSRWLVQDRRARLDPLSHLSGLNAKVDVRHERRTLEPAEISQLIEAARTGKAFWGVSGADRAALYFLALNTGLRAKELASLSRRSFDFKSSPATVTVEAACSKHRRRDTLPIRDDVADWMKAYLASRKLGLGDLLWPGKWTHKGSAKMIRKDLANAQIPYRDEAGRVFDFHALRHQFISTLARSGVHPKEAQVLARHSTITLTMDRYTHLNVGDLTRALAKLPALETSPPARPEPPTTGSRMDPTE